MLSREFIRTHPDLVKKYLGSVVPYTDNFFASLNSAVFSDGSFVYVPKGVRVWSVLSDPYGPNYETSNRSDLALATKADLAWYARTYNVHHPQLVDPDFSTVNQYLKQGYPTIYIVNSRGVITFARSGHIGFQTLARALNGALAGTSAGHTGA